MKNRFKSSLLCILILLTAATACASAADSQEDVANILDRWTDIHWGRDNVAWLVHYPDELIEPWVKSEAAKRKMTLAQTEEFRKYFKQEIKSDVATTFMLSIHSFGTQPLTLAPLSKNIALIDSSGKRMKPVAYEKRLDGPLAGLIQGFVFFPKQSGKDFKVVITGLTPGKETVFAFGGKSGGTYVASKINTGATGKVESKAAATNKKTSASSQQSSQKEVVVTIPTKPASQPKNQASSAPAKSASEDNPPEFEWDEDYNVPPPPETPENPAEPTIEPPVSSSVKPSSPTQANNLFAPAANLPAKKEQVLTLFLKCWVDGDTERMYALLSGESQAKISPELFARAVLGDNFRAGLKGGHKIKWQGQTARVTVSKKMLMMRTLDTKAIQFTEENGVARIVW